MPCFSAYLSSFSRDVSFHSRHGAITRMSGIERVVAEFEAHLIVAFAGGAVTHRVGARLARNFDLALGDQRPCDRGAEQVFALVNRVGTEHREHEVAHEFLAQILDEDFPDAELLRFGTRWRDFPALADVGGERYDFAAIGILQPFEYDRGVEPAGIGEHYFFDSGHDAVVACAKIRILSAARGESQQNQPGVRMQSRTSGPGSGLRAARGIFARDLVGVHPGVGDFQQVDQ